MSAARRLLVILAAGALLGTAPSASRAQVRVVAYVPNWTDLKAFSQTIDYAKLTHINVAFENPVNDAGDLSFNEADALLIARAKEKQVKVLVSIGGDSASADETTRARYASLLGLAKRAAFAAKLADYVARHNFDGLDVDLEGRAITGDYGAFVEELARALKPKGKLLTAALAEGVGGADVPDDALARLDFVNIMAYNETGSWAPDKPGQHSSLEFAKAAASYWIDKRSLPKTKAVLGVPFYGCGFGDAFRKDEYPYRDIVATYPGAENADQAGSTIWYNGLPTIRAKTQYLLDRGLGGVMIWSLDSDSPGKRSLLSAIHQTLTPARKKP